MPRHVGDIAASWVLQAVGTAAAGRGVGGGGARVWRGWGGSGASGFKGPAGSVSQADTARLGRWRVFFNNSDVQKKKEKKY